MSRPLPVISPANTPPAPRATARQAASVAAARRDGRWVRVADIASPSVARRGVAPHLLDLDGELVDLRRGMARALVDAKHRVPRRPGCEAEHLAQLRVEPGALEVDALVALDREIALVGLLELLGCDADEPAVHV